MVGITIARALYALNSGNAKNRTTSSTPRQCHIVLSLQCPIPSSQRSLLSYSIGETSDNIAYYYFVYLIETPGAYISSGHSVYIRTLTYGSMGCISHAIVSPVHHMTDVQYITGTSNGVVPTRCMLTWSPVSIVQNNKVLIEAHSNLCRMGGVHTHHIQIQQMETSRDYYHYTDSVYWNAAGHHSSSRLLTRKKGTATMLKLRML